MHPLLRYYPHESRKCSKIQHTQPTTSGALMSEMIEQAIKESPLFKHLSQEDTQQLIANARLTVFQTGEKIIQENSHAQDLYILLMGRVRVVTTGPDNHPVELKSLGPGGYFGEVSLLNNIPATATVEVRTGPAQTIAISSKAILDLVEKDEKIRHLLTELTIARANDTINKVLK